MLARRAASRSPASGGSAREKRRAVSCTTTTVTTWGFPGTDNEEGENINEGLAALRPKTPGRSGSGVAAGKGDVSVGKIRSSPLRRSTEEKKAGVRKTSGRVGSMSRANAGVKAE